MPVNKDKIKDLFKQGLTEFEVSPPPGVWSGIVQHRRKRRLVIWQWAAAASLALLLGISALLYRSLVEIPQTFTEETTKSQATDDSIIIQPSDHEKLPESQILDIQQLIPILKHYAYTRITKSESVIHLTYESAKPMLISLNKMFENDEAWLKLDAYESMAEVKAITHFPLVDLSSLIDWEPSDNDQPDRWNLALGYGTNPSFAMPPEDYVIEETRSTFAHDNFSSDMAFETAYFEQIESTDHKFPVGLGLMAGFSLSRRWQVESGVVYTRLTTVNRTFAMNSMYREFENSISYLGIPIGIRYHIIHRDLWKLYVGQSLVIEKGLRNRFTTYYYENDVEVNAEATYAPVRGVQVSALSSLGVDFVLSGQFSLYLQGGIQYFFLNETQPYTIRSTNPVWPSVQTGIRYNFK